MDVTRGLKIKGGNASAAGVVATDFVIFQQFLRGADVASASTIAPGIEDYFHVTGATQVNFVSTTNLLDGRGITLYFPSSLVLAHNAASPPAGTAPMLLLTGANTPTGAGGRAWFRYDAGLGALVQIAGVGPGSGVATVSAGPGISITGTSTNVVVNNTGVLSVSAGPGISVTGTGANPTVNNTGVLSVIAGVGISITGSTQNPVVNSTGVITVGAGIGISITGTSSNPVVNNTGVIAISPAQGIIVQGTPQSPIIAAKVIGSLQLGGTVTLSASTRKWVPQGTANQSADPLEWSVEDFITAGASKFNWSGFIFNFVGGPGPIPFAITCGGTVVAGTTFNVSGGGVTVGSGGIPTVIPSVSSGPRRFGLSVVPNGTSATITLGITLTFS